MEFRMTRREMLAGCLAGLGLACLGFAQPQAAFAKTETVAKDDKSDNAHGEAAEVAPLVSFETEPVIIDGISLDLPKGCEFTPEYETDSGIGQYEGSIEGKVSYIVTGHSEGSKWLSLKPDELASKQLNVEGYTQFGVEQYETDDFSLVAFFLYRDANPDLNVAQLLVYGNDEMWRFEIYAQSVAGNDEEAIDVIKQIALSLKPEQGTTQGKKDALKKSAERSKGGR